MGEWKEIELDKVAKLSKRQWKVGDDPLPYIGLEHIAEGRLRLIGLGTSDEVASQKYHFDENSFLFGKLRPYFRKLYRPAFHGICSTDIWVVKACEDIDLDFLFYFFSNKEFIDVSYSGSSGTRMPRADWGFVSSKKWLFPELPEQRAIASVLSSLDAKIDLLHRQNKTLEAMAETLFRQWFVEEAEEGWPWVQLGDHILVHRGLSYNGAGLCDPGDGVPMHNLNSVYEGGGYKYDGIKYYKGEYKDRHVIKAGELIMTNTEQGHEHLLIGCPAIVPKTFGDVGIFSQHVYRIEMLNPLFTSVFVKHLVLTWDMREQIAGATNGSTVNMLPKDGIEMAKFQMPPDWLIKQFNEFALPMHEKREENQVQIESLTALRDTLLPKLMSGEVRVEEEVLI
jgi:type I restriction enzyme S subunit